MDLLSPPYPDKWKAYQPLAQNLQERSDWLQCLCQPPFRPDLEASSLWLLLLPHLRLAGYFPVASCLDLEKAWSRVTQRAGLSRGLAALIQSFPHRLDPWFRLVPLRLVKVARLLGSLSPERQQSVVDRAGKHPLLSPQLNWPSQSLGQACLNAWVPLPPPTRVVEAWGRQLSPREERELRHSLEGWVPRVQLEIVRHYCGSLT